MDHPRPARDSSMSSATRDSVSSSVNGLIQQSFQWLDVDESGSPSGDIDQRPLSLAPPNPAFRSDRSLNLRASPSAASLSSSPLASSNLPTPSRPDSSSSTATVTSTSAQPAPAAVVFPPSRGASMQSTTSSSTASSSQAGYFPLFPSPPRPPEAIQAADHLQSSNNDDDDQYTAVPHSRNESADDAYFYADGGSTPPVIAAAAPSLPPPGPPPQSALPPSPPSTSTYQHDLNHASLNHNNITSIINAPPRQLYDSPHSPGLPPSPRFNDYSPQHSYPQYQQAPHPRQFSSSSSNASYGTATAAAGIPLPSSPYSQHGAFPNHTYPARTASMAHSDRSYHQSQQPSYPHSRNTSAMYPSDGEGANTNQHSPTGGAFQSAAVGAGIGALAGGGAIYLPSSPNPARGAYTHPNATESTIWGAGGGDYSPNGGEYNEKGYYGLGTSNSNNSKAMGMEDSASIVSYGQRKRGSSMLKTTNGGGKNGNRKKWWIIAGIALLVIGAVIVGIVVYLLKRNSNDSVAQDSASDNANESSNSASQTRSSTSPKSTSTTPKPTTTGGDGSKITMENGQSFTYRNQFGGTWSSTPFDDSARAQSYSPALNERWDYSSDKIYGVNIGGWLHTEPFIAPALYEPFADSATPAVDEWSLSLALGDNLRDTMVNHFETFITEEDFAQIAGAGLNWVRIPISFWAIEVYPGEPFLEGVCWEYFLKAITWARKYGLRINLDLHTIPGSQNGWNHSGKMGSIGFLNGAMGMANAQRTINYIRVLTEFINQPEYRNVIPMWGIINEAQANVIGDEVIRAFYLEVYDMIRDITGVGEGNGPVISIHDGFSGNLSTWDGYLTGSDRIVMDSHPYLAFDAPNADPYPVQMTKACNRWGPMFNLSMANVGFSYAGEFSLGINDCGQYLNGVIDGIRYDGTYTGVENVTGSCDMFMDVSLWDNDFKAQVLDFALASMDTFQNWFFWTWKIGESTVYNRVATPMWSYSLGLQEGYVPTDPRAYHGACPAMAEKYNLPAPSVVPFDGSLEPWMTGGAGAGQIAPTQIASYNQWPPVSMANIPLVESLDVALLPTYTATATDLVLTALPTPTTGGAATPVLNSAYFTPIAGCTNYLDPWGAAAATPTGIC